MNKIIGGAISRDASGTISKASILNLIETNYMLKAEQQLKELFSYAEREKCYALSIELILLYQTHFLNIKENDWDKKISITSQALRYADLHAEKNKDNTYSIRFETELKQLVRQLNLCPEELFDEFFKEALILARSSKKILAKLRRDLKANLKLNPAEFDDARLEFNLGMDTLTKLKVMFALDFYARANPEVTICEFTFILIGSSAIRKRCLFSDCDAAFLIADASEASKKQFVDISKIIDTTFKLCGETGLPHSLLTEGYRFDSAGNSPLGIPGLYRLIDSPEGLSKFQEPKMFSQFETTAIALMNARSLYSSKHGDQLRERYFKCVNRTLSSLSPKPSEAVQRQHVTLAQSQEARGISDQMLDIFSAGDASSLQRARVESMLFAPDTSIGLDFIPALYGAPEKKLDEGVAKFCNGTIIKASDRESRAFSIISMAVREFRPILGEQSSNAYFDAKLDFCRLPQAVLAGLAIFYNIIKCSTEEVIDELVRIKMFSEAAASNLKLALSMGYHFRAKAQSFYNNEKALISASSSESPLLFKMDELDTKRAEHLFQVLIPFFEAAEEFVRSQGKKNPFITATLKSDSFSAQHNLHLKIGNHKQASLAAKRSLEINPNQLDLLKSLALHALTSGDAAQGQTYFSECLSKLSKGKDKRSILAHVRLQLYYSRFLNKTASLNKSLAAAETALQLMQTVPEIDTVEDVILYADILDDIGTCLQALQKYSEAMVRYRKSISVYSTINNDARTLECNMQVKQRVVGLQSFKKIPKQPDFETMNQAVREYYVSQFQNYRQKGAEISNIQVKGLEGFSQLVGREDPDMAIQINLFCAKAYAAINQTDMCEPVAAVLFGIGILFSMKGERELANSWLLQAITIYETLNIPSSRVGKAYFLLASNSIDSESFEAAARYLAKLESVTGQPDYELRCAVNVGLNKLELAVDCFKQLIYEEPESFDNASHRAVSDALKQEKRYEIHVSLDKQLRKKMASESKQDKLVWAKSFSMQIAFPDICGYQIHDLDTAISILKAQDASCLEHAHLLQTKIRYLMRDAESTEAVAKPLFLECLSIYSTQFASRPDLFITRLNQLGTYKQNMVWMDLPYVDFRLKLTTVAVGLTLNADRLSKGEPVPDPTVFSKSLKANFYLISKRNFFANAVPEALAILAPFPDALSDFAASLADALRLTESIQVLESLEGHIDTKHLHNLGLMHWLKKEFSKAELAWKKTTAASDINNSHVHQALIFLNEGKLDEGIALCQKMITHGKGVLYTVSKSDFRIFDPPLKFLLTIFEPETFKVDSLGYYLAMQFYFKANQISKVKEMAIAFQNAATDAISVLLAAYANYVVGYKQNAFNYILLIAQQWPEAGTRKDALFSDAMAFQQGTPLAFEANIKIELAVDHLTEAATQATKEQAFDYALTLLNDASVFNTKPTIEAQMAKVRKAKDATVS